MCKLRAVTSEKNWRPDAVLMLIACLLILMAFASVSPALGEKLSAKMHWKLGEWPRIGGMLVIHAVMLVMLGVFIRAHQVSWADFLGLTRRGRQGDVPGNRNRPAPGAAFDGY